MDADGDGTNTNDYTALTVVAGTEDVNLPKIMSDAFVAGTAAELTFVHEQEDGDSETTGNQPVKAFETAGTYNGAMGTYRCNGDAACTVMLDADGKITEVSVGWIFTPAMGATSDVADANYLHYGFWLKKTTRPRTTRSRPSRRLRDTPRPAIVILAAS